MSIPPQTLVHKDPLGNVVYPLNKNLNSISLSNIGILVVILTMKFENDEKYCAEVSFSENKKAGNGSSMLESQKVLDKVQGISCTLKVETKNFLVFRPL